MENNESALCALRAPSQTEIEPANQSYLHRSKAGIGHLFKQMTNINRRAGGRCRGRAPCKAWSGGCEFELDV